MKIGFEEQYVLIDTIIVLEEILREGLYIDIGYLIVIDRGESTLGIDSETREEEIKLLVTEDELLRSKVGKITHQIHHILLKE